MPPPIGVVSGPLMPTRNSRKASTVSSGSQVPTLSNDFWPGVDLHPGDLALAAVGLRDRGVEHAHAGAPDVGAGAVALDEGDDRLVGHLELAVLDGDLRAGGRDLRVRVRHFGERLLGRRAF